MNLLKTKEFIVNWISQYSTKHGIKKLVVGISGGIDSALTSKLCALSGINTIVVSMPIHQRKNELQNANTHINWLLQKHKNVNALHLDLTHLFEEYKKLIPIELHSDLGFANSRARLRMTTLYQISSNDNGIVVGTGNKIEDFGIGFFTKYGDGGVDISPIADLTKTEVRKLAEFCGVNPIIINTPPTDGLWPDARTDESQIGATYAELEYVMNLENNCNLNNREKKVFEIYNALNKKNQHKIAPIPVCKVPKKYLKNI